MKRTLKTLLFLLFTTTLVFNDTHSIPTDDPTTASNNIDFIRTSCNATLYPDLCYTSLAGYANAIQQDPSRLARAAIIVSLKRAHHLAEYLSNLTQEAEYGSDPRVTSALHDCFSNLGDAVDQIRDSLKQMRHAVSAGSGSFRFQMSNVQTWMSAALTDEETCTDGFEDVADGQMKSDVCDRSEEVKRATSNALALVNSYAEKGMQ